MLRDAIYNVSELRNDVHPNLQIWPSLGLLEARLWESEQARNVVLIHDPIPLRRQVGFDAISTHWASKNAKRVSPLIMVHSDDALRATERLLPKHTITKALHPIKTAQNMGEKSPEPLVVVAGQYKPERNLEILAAIGPHLRAKGIRAQILGRGWPDGIPGWTVSDKFVAEDDLDAILAAAWCVLLPYDLYFQSGIAIRALENGTLTVTPRTSFGEDLLGLNSPSIIDDKRSPRDTISAIEYTLDHRGTAGEHFTRYRDLTDQSWRRALLSISD
ncbi:hypothetical protein GA0061083_0530 [Pseudarthrobacter enclensis]|uniref:hypothetical protein n=1 Tax=Pseudarthrobacter enclensis TaxID=993070 RepID=UPI0008161CBC|nr:hypothetical protein [Pseudarthrobacter enclensis]SCB75488.1 hypothetical protein GA0061083_0530 [Pseudarthrobacter enclensis]